MFTARLQDNRLLHIYINFQQGNDMEVRGWDGSSTTQKLYDSAK